MRQSNVWVRADGLKVLRDHLSDHAVDWGALAHKFQFDLEVLDATDGVVSLTAFQEILDLVPTLVGNDALLFDVFSSRNLGEFTVFDYLFICAPTIRDGCIAWDRSMPIRTNAIEIKYSELGGVGYLEWIHSNLYGPWRQNMFARMGWAAGRFESALGETTAPINIEIAAEPPVHVSKFQERYASRIKFNASRNVIRIEKEILDRKPRRHEDNLYAIVQRSALQELATVSASQSPVVEISEKIAEALKTGACNLNAVARSYGTSPRSLQRLLEQHGTSFRQLTDDVRKTSAKRYLLETRLPMKEIAFLLGFGEISAFSRASKAWFGAAPKSIRQGHNTIPEDGDPALET